MLNLRTLKMVLIVGAVYWATSGPGPVNTAKNTTPNHISALDRTLESLDSSLRRGRRADCVPPDGDEGTCVGRTIARR